MIRLLDKLWLYTWDAYWSGIYLTKRKWAYLGKGSD